MGVLIFSACWVLVKYGSRCKIVRLQTWACRTTKYLHAEWPWDLLQRQSVLSCTHSSVREASESTALLNEKWAAGNSRWHVGCLLALRAAGAACQSDLWPQPGTFASTLWWGRGLCAGSGDADWGRIVRQSVSLQWLFSAHYWMQLWPELIKSQPYPVSNLVQEAAGSSFHISVPVLTTLLRTLVFV